MKECSLGRMKTRVRTIIEHHVHLRSLFFRIEESDSAQLPVQDVTGKSGLDNIGAIQAIYAVDTESAFLQRHDVFVRDPKVADMMVSECAPCSRCGCSIPLALKGAFNRVNEFRDVLVPVIEGLQAMSVRQPSKCELTSCHGSLHGSHTHDTCGCRKALG